MPNLRQNFVTFFLKKIVSPDGVQLISDQKLSSLELKKHQTYIVLFVHTCICNGLRTHI